MKFHNEKNNADNFIKLFPVVFINLNVDVASSYDKLTTCDCSKN